MRLTEAEFRKLGYQAVDMAAKYFVEVPRGPVFQRMHESERQALMNMPMPAAASLTALATARHRALGQLGIDVREQGVGNHARLRIYASTEVHSCIQKAVELLGLGSDSIRWIEVDEDFRVSLDHLRRAVRDDREQGWHPFCVVASAGSVQTGAINPLDALAGFASESNLWMHVDGAYGAAAMLDPQSRPLLEGIERADSIALDPHKWLSVPVECGCVLVRDGALLRDTFSLVPAYVRTEAGKGIGNLPWFAEYGMQQTRGFRALKLWVTLATPLCSRGNCRERRSPGRAE